MKQKETLLNLAEISEVDAIGEEHFSESVDTPLRDDAFAISDREKIALIESRFREIMDIMGLDLTDASLKGTPNRVAKMYINEIFSGLNPANKPKISLFPNTYGYRRMLVEKNITLHSYCEHHFVPILGVVHVAYIPNEHVIGLSKINRVVRFFAKRPQVQERLTNQIGEELKALLKTEHVAVIVDAEHLCVKTRGIEDVNSATVTTFYSGAFEDDNTRKEFFKHLD
ncbi:MAG: GTP cyclohydrolase I FolE [Luteibaculaceae bacterium]